MAEYARFSRNWTGPRCELLLGRATEFPEYYPEGGAFSALYLAQIGHDNEAKEVLKRNVLERPAAGDATPINNDIAYLEAALIIKYEDVIERLSTRLAENTPGHIAGGYGPCPQRILGASATFLGKYKEARDHYIESIKMSTIIKSRPEIALTRLQLAELLLEHYPAEKKEALEHLDFAIKEFREMKMQPSLERALRHKEILKA